MKELPAPKPCACCVRPKSPWRALVCLCGCHVGPPFSLALFVKTWADMDERPHLISVAKEPND